MNICNRIKLESKHFPLASPRSALRQGARLLRAKEYLKGRGIEAITMGSQFHYERAIGSILQ